MDEIEKAFREMSGSNITDEAYEFSCRMTQKLYGLGDVSKEDIMQSAAAFYWAWTHAPKSLKE